VIDGAPVQQKEEGESMKKLIEVINISTPPSNHTFKRLIRQLREAKKEVVRLKAEGLSERIKMKELMDMYSNTLHLAILAARGALPLHKQLKNLYRQNRGFQSQNRKLKAELQHFKDELVQRNLNLLVEVAIEREEPVVKKNTLAVKKPVTKKKNMMLS
jgi:Pyruvate/2-oxoacid:ferredoxin oxidoreductase gamma subunit